MSHFSVFVMTPHKPSHAELAAIMQPWHEFECTGTDDQYVIDVDTTDELRAAYETHTRDMLRLADGTMVSKYADAYFNRPLPDGATELEVKIKDSMSFAEFVQYETERKTIRTGEKPRLIGTNAPHKYGWTELDANSNVVRTIRRTNPNAQWDYWVIGGRYTGKFAPGYVANDDDGNKETCWLCHGTGQRNDELGREARAKDPSYNCNGCSGTGKQTKFPSKWKDIGNQCRVGDIPMEALATASEMRALKEYDRAHAIIAGRPIPNWGEIRKRHEPNIDAARNEYHDSDVVKDLRAADFWLLDNKLEEFALSRDEVAKLARRRALTCYAIVKDGKWAERGDMGWFGMASNEMSERDWQEIVYKTISELPPDWWITTLDCHI